MAKYENPPSVPPSSSRFFEQQRAASPSCDRPYGRTSVFDPGPRAARNITIGLSATTSSVIDPGPRAARNR